MAVECVRCGNVADSSLNWLHENKLCKICNEMCCYTCKYWCPYNQIYEDPLEPDNCGVCDLTKQPTWSHEKCDNFRRFN